MNLNPLDGNEFRKAIKDMLTSHGIRYKSSILKLGDEDIMASGESYVLVSLEIPLEDAEKMANIEDSVFGVRVTYESAHGQQKVWCNDDRIKEI